MVNDILVNRRDGPKIPAGPDRVVGQGSLSPPGPKPVVSTVVVPVAGS